LVQLRQVGAYAKKRDQKVFDGAAATESLTDRLNKTAQRKSQQSGWTKGVNQTPKKTSPD
jgi:hypothetical protein